MNHTLRSTVAAGGVLLALAGCASAGHKAASSPSARQATATASTNPRAAICGQFANLVQAWNQNIETAGEFRSGVLPLEQQAEHVAPGSQLAGDLLTTSQELTAMASGSDDGYSLITDTNNVTGDCKLNL